VAAVAVAEEAMEDGADDTDDASGGVDSKAVPTKEASKSHLP